MVEKIQPNRERGIASRLLSGGAWVLLGRIISALGGLLVSMLLARVLTHAELGAYFIVFSITVTGAMLAQFGTHLSVMRIVAVGLALGDLKEVKRGLKAVLLIVLTGILIISAGYTAGAGNWIALHIFDSELVSSVTGLTALWLALRVGQTLLSQVFRGFHDLRLAAIFSGAFTQVILLLALLVLWLSVDGLLFEQVVRVTVAAFAITVIIGLFLLRNNMGGLPSIEGVSLRKTVNLSAPLFISSTSIIVLGEMHLWILGAVATPDQVALYGAVYRLMQFVLIPLNLVNNLIPPMIAELYAKKSMQKVEQVLRTTATLASLPAVVVLIIMMLFAKPLLGITYGSYFVQGGPILVVMTVGQIVNVMTGSPGVLLSMSNHQTMLMKISVFCGLLGILISAFLVGKYGVLGVAFGFTAGLVFQNITLSYFCWKKMDVRTFPGYAALRYVYYRIRGELARRAQFGGWLGAAERVVRPVENALCYLAGVRIVECFGDSHVNVFSWVNRSHCSPKVYFRVTVVRGATAFGLENPNSRTNALQVFSRWLAKIPPQRPVLFILGEVDLGYLIWVKVEKEGLSPQALMKDAVSRYTRFLAQHKGAHKRIIIVTAPLPAVKDGNASESMNKLRPNLKVSQHERTELSLKYNRLLQEWAHANDSYLLDLDDDLLDKSTGLLKETYLKRGEVDNHLDPEAFSSLVCRLVACRKFTDWLNAKEY